MSSNYQKYLEEREGYSLIEDENGFASYKIFGDECYIRDIFVVKGARDQKVGSGYCDQIVEIAKAAGCKYLTGTVVPEAKGSTVSLMAIIKYGFKLHSSTQEKIVLMKEL